LVRQVAPRLSHIAAQVVNPLDLVMQGLQKWLQTPETQQLDPHPSPLLAQTCPQAPQFFQSLLVSPQAAVVPLLLPPTLTLLEPPMAAPLPPVATTVAVELFPPLALALPPLALVLPPVAAVLPPLALVPLPVALVLPLEVLPPVEADSATQTLLRHSSPWSQVPLP
jgi:hypothetical protein